ncbi:MAG TPA: metal ABC transporter permease [Spirochaetota bacterium]|nr:metal ABC transporter permease [Spirochaetota bacterium]HPG49636.1 metal ABC transporter permease [Spirochaetota bacterium]HPN14408.1 metal ABC transporter permease [Spirochaetota bacterium]
MIELFQLQFFRNAFIMSLLLGVLFGVLSFFVVMRKMSFLGAGIAHTAFGGVALGVLLGINPFLTSFAFCVAAAILIGKLVRYGKLSFDAGIGIFFSLSMALGAIFLALKKGYTFDLMSYLFGNILGVTHLDTLIALVTLVIFIIFIIIFMHRILFMTIDEEVAAVSGVRTGALDTALLIFLAVIIVTSIKIVGIILVSALVVLPASFGLIISRDYRKVILGAILFTITVMTGGLFLSYYLDLPAGATMVTAGSALYFISLVIAQKIIKRKT